MDVGTVAVDSILHINGSYLGFVLYCAMCGFSRRARTVGCMRLIAFTDTDGEGDGLKPGHEWHPVFTVSPKGF